MVDDEEEKEEEEDKEKRANENKTQEESIYVIRDRRGEGAERKVESRESRPEQPNGLSLEREGSTKINGIA